MKKEEFNDIGQEEYITNGKRKMLYAGASLNANAVMNAKLAPSTLETMAKVDSNICSYMVKRYAETYILRGRTEKQWSNP